MSTYRQFVRRLDGKRDLLVLGDRGIQFAGIAHQHRQDPTRIRRRQAAPGVFQPGDLGKAALDLLDLANPVLQRRDDVRAFQLEGRQGVLERQHRQNLAHCHRPGIDRGAQPAAIGEGNRDAMVLDPRQLRVGDKVAHLALADPAIGAVAVDDRGSLGHHAIADLFQRRGQFADPRHQGCVLGDLAIHDNRLADRRGDHATVIPGDVQFTQELAVSIGLDDCDPVAVRPVDPGRVRPGGLF